MKKMKKWIAALIAVIMTAVMMPMTAMAAGTTTLTVDGVDALTTSSGEGWSFNSSTSTLTLDGYNGGSIVATYMDLKVVLAEGSKNVISTTEEYGLANVHDPYDGPYNSLSIEGTANSSLEITANNHAIFAHGSISIVGCNLVANTTTSIATGNMECISSHSTIDIENCNITVNTNGVGITCYNEHNIVNSTITVNAGIIGVHANNENLTITGSTLNITGGTAALYSYFGTIQLTNCTGELDASTAAIYGQNLSAESDTTLKDCELTLNAPYGIMTYSGIFIENGDLTLNCDTGVYAYSASYQADSNISGTAVVDGTPCTTRAFLIYGTYSSEDTAEVNGIIHQNLGDTATEKVILSGTMSISKDTAYAKIIEIQENANITVEQGVSFDLSAAPSVTVSGVLTNRGTLTLNGEQTENQGTIYNYGVISLADSKSIINNGTIYSACTSEFDLTPYGESGIVMHTQLVKVDAKDPTYTSAGNIEYWYCENCDKYFSDEAATQEIAYEDTIIPMLEQEPDTTTENDDTDTSDTSDTTQANDTEKNTSAQSEKKGSATSPKTGADENFALIWVSVLAACAAVLTTATVYKRKRKYSK